MGSTVAASTVWPSSILLNPSRASLDAGLVGGGQSASTAWGPSLRWISAACSETASPQYRVSGESASMNWSDGHKLSACMVASSEDRGGPRKGDCVRPRYDRADGRAESGEGEHLYVERADCHQRDRPRRGERLGGAHSYPERAESSRTGCDEHGGEFFDRGPGVIERTVDARD